MIRDNCPTETIEKYPLLNSMDAKFARSLETNVALSIRAALGGLIAAYDLLRKETVIRILLEVTGIMPSLF